MGCAVLPDDDDNEGRVLIAGGEVRESRSLVLSN